MSSEYTNSLKTNIIIFNLIYQYRLYNYYKNTMKIFAYLSAIALAAGAFPPIAIN